ncbi:hypothetical protein KP79_PYT21681 [Mizuhopecten yessoensis]|uniref:Uncharacterized protein n=1 Tax=Mizuhopecten yessoensis TaxID=6573 RepID=A0A210R716_MIZYE|nr:hypothetical protein KP79_PYT21681 [Mizuhopecten yessoensis]
MKNAPNRACTSFGISRGYRFFLTYRPVSTQTITRDVMEDSLIKRAGDKHAKSGEDMLGVFIEEINRFDVLSDIVSTDKELILTLEEIENSENADIVPPAADDS